MVIWQEQRRIADLASRVKIPPGAPRIRDWYVERKPLVVQACNRLGIGQGGDTPQAPKMVGLAGPSGAGKSTVASMVIARDDVRAYFEKGVLWLQVGQAAKDRLPELKSRLADMVYESVMQKACRPPRKQEDLASDPEDGVEYIVDVMNKDMMRFLVVADDVWDVEVLEALKRAGAWVLYTTRHRDLLPEPPRPLRVDQMLKEEAELVLRRAADLHDDAYLPNAAYELMERCDYAASDLAFVGRWSDVRGRSGHDGQAWQAVLNRIMEEAKRSGEDGQLLSWRAAVLHAGLDELACENPKNKELYLSLAILPNGLAFSSEVAAVLLYGSGFSAWDLEAAEGVVMTLERLSILTLEDGGSYRVHDEHADFIQGRGVANQDIWDRVLCRWREYMSSSRALFAFSTHWLVVIWEVLACAEGTGLVSRPYDPALDAMDPTGSDIAKALKKGAYFHWLREEWSEVYSKSSRLLEIQENGDRGNSLDVARVLNALGVCAGKAGRTQEAEELFRRALAILEDKLGVDHPGVANTLNILGLYAFESGKMEEAEKSYRRALAVQQDNLGIDHADVADTLDNLGVCAHESGKTEEAEELYRRSLAIREARLGFDHPDVADTLCSLGMCAGNVGRMEEAEKLYQRALSIQENKLGVDHPDLADILDNLGACAHEAGRMEKAEELYQRVLAIREEKLGVDHPDVASTLDKLGSCVGKTGRAKEGEGLFRRALAIREGTLGTE